MAVARHGWWRSAGVLFGFAYAILFAFSTIAVVAFVWWSTAGALDRQTQEAIASDQREMLEVFAEGGLVAVAAQVHKLAYTGSEDSIYLLVDPNLRKVRGSLPGWPEDFPEDAKWARLKVAQFDKVVPAELLQVPLGSTGFRLLIGRDVHMQTGLWVKLIRSAPWIIIIMFALGIFGAVTVRRLFVSMLGDVSKTATAISAGDLASRVQLSGRGDEFDELAATINDMLDRIGRLMDGVREVSNAIAHDLRTPISRARARLEDAARSSSTEAELHAAVERAIADLDGVTAIFHALLRIAEIEAGSRRSAFATFDAAPLLRDLAELYEAAADEGGHALVLETPKTLLTFGDRDMLQQAVANLLDNALKFSPPGGAVRIFSTRLPNQAVTITVSDQGPGIPECDRERATERFFRGESARHAPGSGLGLSLVQAVAVLHGGSLRLEDNAPGLRASLILPLTAAALMERVSREPQAAAIPHAA